MAQVATKITRQLTQRNVSNRDLGNIH